ncbi:choice-of-anchor D domain-containing protein [Bradymonadaceae bacterium TMQ3]|uniref:Choice-of-anchor D domain-containing protein n=1 Tax=Lujinxingia sediminis TaxID=2480984 RepID=A0ABY0CVT8_9DELT|nr:choice-of-anchor D domain-containing protein [Lujinxingia sediminis]RDV37322.1 choice-of-anchor D domain-containing protein [Bradymonadaceae bacterium TMQ3]RVU46729.1 choice-of-anchor D domain-containing protein [Lujinxingia sediminis]TXC74740.1 choice-of-anchor D domain-containing protein [Bradymonadales bacterium TMQ1]
MIQPPFFAHRPSGLTLLLSVFLSLVLFACGDDDGDGNITGTDAATLTVNPTQLNFEQVAIDDSIAELIVIENTGAATLTVDNFQIQGENASAFSLAEGTPSSLRLAPNELAEIYVQYAPTAIAASSGVLNMRSNDPSRQSFNVELRADAPSPQIFTPEIVTFARTPEGSEEWRVTEIANIGYAPLEIDSIVLDGHSDFSITYPQPTGEEEEGQFPDRANDTTVAPDLILPGESVMVRVIFLPTSSDFRTAEITIESNDAASPRTKVLISANSDAPCLEVDEEINFGQASIDNIARRTVTVTNCSAIAELVIGKIEFEDDAGVFDVAESSLPGNLSTDGVANIGPRQSANFVLTYAPLEEVLNEGVLKITSNDAARQNTYVDVVGQGSLLTCPNARARARVQGTSRWFDASEGIVASPLATIELDGSLSDDPDGTQVTYEWSLRDKPLSAQTQISPSITSESPTLWLPYAGRYVVELTVYDGAGLTSCEPAEFFIDVVPGGDIWVELAWETVSGARTDMDLHYLNLENADRWNSRPWDVYYGNRNPTWNDGSETSLDRDDLCCGGPENVNHNDAVAGDYAVGVYFYSGGGGGTDVTVNIYLGGSLAQTQNRRMNASPEFWYVADIGIPQFSVTVYDELFPNGYPSL